MPATLVLYENDRHPIKHSTAVALANALGIDRNRLLDKYTAFVDYPYSSLLKKVRQDLSLTQMQMAEVIGIGQTSYSGWEREIRVPRRKEYEKILAALKKLKVNVDIYLCQSSFYLIENRTFAALFPYIYNRSTKEECQMRKRKLKIFLTPTENSIVIQSLNHLRNALLRENRDTGCLDELLLKVMCAPVKKM